MWSQSLPLKPYSLHVPLIEAIIAMHDMSVWSIRDVVRSVEQVRGAKGIKDIYQADDSVYRTARIRLVGLVTF
jgi:hypothetical protein